MLEKSSVYTSFAGGKVELITLQKEYPNRFYNYLMKGIKDRMGKKWLSQLNKIIGSFLEGEDSSIINAERKTLSRLYNKYDSKEKAKIHYLIKSMCIPNESDTLWFLSFIISIVNSDFILELLIDIISRSKFNIFKIQSIEMQLRCSSIEYRYELQYKIHEMILKKDKEILLEEYPYINADKRNRDKIVIITEQILGLKHSPTARVLEYAYYLQEVLHKEVYLIVMPSINILTEFEWYNRAGFNYLETLTGKKAYTYKGVSISICQVLFHQNYIEDIQKIIKEIVEIKPMFVFNMGTVAPLGDIISRFLTVVSDNMSTFYPVSIAQILLKYGTNRNSEVETFIKNKNQRLLFMQPIVNVQPVNRKVCKEELDISKEVFAIALVGNRLDIDIDEEYILFLENLLNIEPRILYVVIGEMKTYKYLFEKLDNRKKSKFLGSQKDLTSVLGAMDLYLNPHRKGGGISALMALKAGTPVVTLDGCDVAFNVGDDFICFDETEEIDLIINYVRKGDFYKEQVEKGIARVEKISDVESENKKVLDMIYEIIDKEF